MTSKNNLIAACSPILIALPHSFVACHHVSVCSIPYPFLSSSHLVIMYSPMAPSCGLVPLFRETIVPIPCVGGVGGGMVMLVCNPWLLALAQGCGRS